MGLLAASDPPAVVPSRAPLGRLVHAGLGDWLALALHPLPVWAYIAYFNRGQFQGVIDLATATQYRTPKAEESLLWRGWARYRLGDLSGAVEGFQAALAINPNYLDAQYALEYVGVR